MPTEFRAIPHISQNRLSTAPRVALYLHFVHCHILAECVVGCDLQFVCETMCDGCVKGPGSGKCARTQVVQVPEACHVLHCRTFEGNGVWPRCGTGEQAQEVVKGLDVVVADHLLNKFTTLHTALHCTVFETTNLLLAHSCSVDLKCNFCGCKWDSTIVVVHLPQCL